MRPSQLLRPKGPPANTSPANSDDIRPKRETKGKKFPEEGAGNEVSGDKTGKQGIQASDGKESARSRLKGDVETDKPAKRERGSPP